MVFWMELVPSLGRELVECCLAEVREEVVLSPVPVVCLRDPSIQVCEYDETSYPHAMVSTILDTFSTEMNLLLKYVKPTMMVK